MVPLLTPGQLVLVVTEVEVIAVPVAMVMAAVVPVQPLASVKVMV